MTIADFLSDRLGRIVLQGGCAAASALFLLATGTQPGVVALLLMGLILVFVLAQLWECVRLRRLGGAKGHYGGAGPEAAVC